MRDHGEEPFYLISGYLVSGEIEFINGDKVFTSGAKDVVLHSRRNEPPFRQLVHPMGNKMIFIFTQAVSETLSSRRVTSPSLMCGSMPGAGSSMNGYRLEGYETIQPPAPGAHCGNGPGPISQRQRSAS